MSSVRDYVDAMKSLYEENDYPSDRLIKNQGRFPDSPTSLTRACASRSTLRMSRPNWSESGRIRSVLAAFLAWDALSGGRDLRQSLASFRLHAHRGRRCLPRCVHITGIGLCTCTNKYE